MQLLERVFHPSTELTRKTAEFLSLIFVLPHGIVSVLGAVAVLVIQDPLPLELSLMLLNSWVSPNSSSLTSNWTETELSLKISISSCSSLPDKPIFVHNKKLEKMERNSSSSENFSSFSHTSTGYFATREQMLFLTGTLKYIDANCLLSAF